jgi:outer membrane receptor protein involved in Fe transport
LREGPQFKVKEQSMRKHLLVVLGLAAICPRAAWAQPAEQRVESTGSGNVEGLVTTADGRAVVGARVGVVGMDEPKSTSDVDGHFRLDGLPSGHHRLRAELEGFGRRERLVDVEPGATTRLRMTLPFLPFSETVTVTATRSERKLGDSPSDLTVLTREDLQHGAAAALDEALKQVPSFSLFRRTSSLVSHPTTQGVSLRGVGASGASRTLVMVDGVPHNDPFGNWVYWDSIPQLQVDAIEVAPSGMSHLYGSSAMAGVITIMTRRPEPRTAAARAFGGSRGSVNSELFGSHTFGPVAASVGGSYFRTDGYNLVREDQRGPVDEEASSRHRTGNWRLEYSPSSSFTVFTNGRVFAEDRDNGTPLQTNSTRETYVGGGLRATTGGNNIWQANVYTHMDDFESTFSAVSADRSSETLSLAQVVDYQDAGANAQWTRTLGRSHELGVGGDVRWIGADNNEDVFIPPMNNVRDRLIPANQLYAGGYLQDVITLEQRAVLTLGLRVDHWRNYDASQTEIVNASGFTTVTNYQDASKTRVTPRAGLLYHVNDRVALRGSVYGGFRAPSLNELYRPFRVGNVLTNGNPALGPERVLGGEIGLNHAATSRFSWQATGFWDQVDDPIANVTLTSTPALITRQRQNLGQARVRGVSAEADYQPAVPLRIRASYVLSDARVQEFPANPAIEGNLLPQVPRHRASIRLDYLNPEVLNLSVRGRFESLRFDDDLNNLRLDGLFVLDVSLDRAIGSSWGAFVAIENLFDERYPVQATPVELLGTPFTVSAGLRFDLRRN